MGRESKPEEIHEEIEVLDDDEDPTQLEEFDEYYEAGPSGSGANPGEEGLQDDGQADDFLGGCLISTGDGKVQCVPCGKILSHYTSARRHYINTHTNLSESATCHLCMRTYKNSQTMKSHMKRDHGISQKMINEQKKGGNSSFS